MIAFFPRNIHWSSLFARKARENTERLPPGHPIILHKFDKFNMAAVSVEWSVIGCIRQHMYPINLNFYKSPSNKLYLQSLQPNKSILIHIAPVYLLGNILTYCAANGGANQWTIMVLLSLFPVKCWVVDQEQSKWRYTNNVFYRRPQSVWYIPKPTEGER